MITLVLPKQSKLRVVPLTLAKANDAIAKWHRHHKPVVCHRFSLGVVDEIGTLRGVLCAGRPVARMIDQELVLEVNRVATDGCPNACSALYGSARRVALAMGFDRVMTYILDTEPGTSLRAAGWISIPVSHREIFDTKRPSQRKPQPQQPWAKRCKIKACKPG